MQWYIRASFSMEKKLTVKPLSIIVFLFVIVIAYFFVFALIDGYGHNELVGSELNIDASVELLLYTTAFISIFLQLLYVVSYTTYNEFRNSIMEKSIWKSILVGIVSFFIVTNLLTFFVCIEVEFLDDIDELSMLVPLGLSFTAGVYFILQAINPIIDEETVENQ